MEDLIKQENDVFRFNVKYYREKKGWNQRNLSIETDYSTGAIGSLEAGSSKPSFDMIIKIAHALDVHPADLFLRDCSVSRANIKKQLETVLIGEIKNILEKQF